MPTPFARSLKYWREKRGLSQLQMSVKSGISTRHLSYLENAKAEPSKEMLATIAGTLALSKEEEDALFVAAGFHRRSTGVVSEEVLLLLTNHEPFPGFVITDDYTLVAVNDGFKTLMTGLEVDVVVGQNFFDLFTPKLRSCLDDWAKLERYFSTLLNRSMRVRDESSLNELAKQFDNPLEETDTRFGVHLDGETLFFRPVSARIETAHETSTQLRVDFLIPEDDLCRAFFD